MTLHRVEAVELVEIEGGDQFLGQTSPQISIYTLPALAGGHLAELDAPQRVAEGVEGRGPERHAHHVGHHQQDSARHPGLGRQTNLERELSAAVR